MLPLSHSPPLPPGGCRAPHPLHPHLYLLFLVSHLGPLPTQPYPRSHSALLFCIHLLLLSHSFAQAELSCVPTKTPLSPSSCCHSAPMWTVGCVGLHPGRR